MDKRKGKQKEELIPEQAKKFLRETFANLKEKVLIEVFTGAETAQLDDIVAELVKTVASLSDKIEVGFYPVSSDQARKRGVTRAPSLLIDPEKFRIRYIGAPVGEEGRTLITAILLASNRGVILSEAAVKRLRELQEPRLIQVFVTPTCPYCPQQALNAISAAIVRPDLVTAEVIEMYENKDYIEKYHIITVPFTVINEVPIGTGLKTPELFVEEVISLVSSEKLTAPPTGETVEMDIAVIGGGPAGLTAGMYAGRSGLKTVILEKGTVGGQVLITPVVENYPGYSQIAGRTLVDVMYQQTLQYAHISEGEEVSEIRETEDFFEVKTGRRTYKVKGIILVTGAEHRKLGVPGEDALYGRGLSYCATCDGYFFKDGKRVIVVGGGNTALTDALYLNSIGAEVSLVHWRDTLRAEKFLQQSLEERKIPILWNTVIKEIIGTDSVTGVKLQDLSTGVEREMPVDGVFVAIGYEPNNVLAKMLGLTLDQEGYIKVDSKQRTSMRMVYAAGDVTGGIKQIATAVGQGAIAAVSAFEDISSPYWKEKGSEWWAA
ncbi:MAG: FAD-dependent oxidoreductase [Alphaproteobacteria bacterium]|uniref:FAD-dependent oxidoreductase n=1 Tax=Candidatus Nitrobium versatile TaxID=2884831 RepID=A0A953SH16_9BACT|nr:FAD-dependent oxidoreductase [Candidatus Nitrobium versatile]